MRQLFKEDNYSTIRGNMVPCKIEKIADLSEYLNLTYKTTNAISLNDFDLIVREITIIRG